MTWFGKFKKYTLRLLLAVPVGLLLTLLLLQLPPVQSYLTGRAEQYLRKKLQTEIRIEAIRLHLFRSLVVRGVYLEDRARDTLLNVEELALGFSLSGLLRREIEFTRLSLEDVFLYLATDSTGRSNYDFITEAFGDGSEPTDGKDVPPEETSGAPSWNLKAQRATLRLRKVRMVYLDELAGTELDINLDRLTADLPLADWRHNRYQAGAIDGAGIFADIRLAASSESENADTRGPSPYYVDAASIDLEQAAVRLQLDTQRLAAGWNVLNTGAVSFQLGGDDMALKLPSLTLEEGRFQYGKPAPTRADRGVDPRHIDFQGLNLEALDVLYDDEVWAGEIRRFSGRDSSDFVLEQLAARFRYSPESASLEGFVLQTPGSRLESINSAVEFKAEEPMANWRVALDWKMARLSPDEIRYWYPALARYPFFDERTPPIRSEGRLSGDLGELRVEKLVVQNRDLRLDLAGRLMRVTTPADLGVDLEIRNLQSTPRGITAWLPAGALPEYLELPDQSSLQGRLEGSLDSLRLNLTGETRRGPLPVVSRLAATARLSHLDDPDQLGFAVEIDSSFITRASLLAYLPPDVLPPDSRLPESFRLQGAANGRLASFTTDLNLRTFRESRITSYNLSGRLDSLTGSTGPGGDLTLTVNGLDRSELDGLLPAAWLPDSMQWPDLSRLSAHFQGDPDSVAIDVRWNSNLGEGKLAGTLFDRRDYELLFQLSPFRPQRLFVEHYLDTLLGFSVAPLAIQMEVDGSGWDASPDTRGNLRLNIWKQAAEISSGLELNAVVRDRKLDADLEAREPGWRSTASLLFDYGAPLAQTNFSLNLRELDLQQLSVSEIPIQLSGTLSARLEGLSEDTLSGRLLAGQWSMLYDSTRQIIESLLLTADLDKGEKNVRLTSDLVDAELTGFFRFSQMATALRQQLIGYWDDEAVDSLVGETPDRFDFEMKIHRPEVLTMGFIPGLEELGQTAWSFRYDNREAAWQTDLSIDRLQYSQNQLDTLNFKASAAAGTFQYQLEAQNINLRELARVPAIRWTGDYQNERLAANFVAFDASGEARFELANYFRRFDGGYEWRLDERQLLDYQQWRVAADNAVILRGENIKITNWRLFRGAESIILEEVGEDRLRMRLQALDLDLVANVLDQQNPYLGGIINGTLTISQPLQKLSAGANLTVDSLTFFDARLGNLMADGDFDQESVLATLNLSGAEHDLQLAGAYRLKTAENSLDFQVDCRRLDLAALEPLTFGYLEQLTGALKGRLHVGGSVQKPALDGAIHFDSTGFDVAMLNTQLRLGDQPIVFDSKGITFQNLELFDANGNRGVLTRGLETSDYRTFVFNTDLEADNFQVLNTTSADNDLYYGRLAVDLRVLLRGGLTDPDISAFARPRKGSDLTYVYRSGTPQVASWRGVVEFVTPEEEEEKEEIASDISRVSRELNLKVAFQMEMTENLTFKVVTNPLTDDYFAGKATGNLNYDLYPDGRMELTGQVYMREGRYMFTYQEVVRRTFTVAPESMIRWTGDPLNPELDVSVLYEVETSPFPLIAQSGENVESIKGKEIFRVVLDISGAPSRTDIETRVEYPTLPQNSNSEVIQSAVARINRDPTEQNTQAFALILFNGFLGGNAGGQGDFQVSDLELESNIGNLITKQLNNLANRYINFVELDIDLENYERRGAGLEDAQADFRVSLRKQFLNDRLAISVDGVASAQTADSQTAGATYTLDNLTLEYMLTADGLLRIKVYNQRDYNDIITGNNLKVGGALVFSKDFNSIRLTPKRKQQ